MYKLIALDMDGTLLNENKQISKANYNAIQEAKKNGFKVVLATGRPLVGVKKFLEELDLISDNDYVVAFNGALVQTTKSKRVVSQTTLTLDDYKELYELSKEYNVNIHALTKDDVIAPKNSKYTQVEADLNGIGIRIMPVQEVSKDEVIVKVMFIDEPELLDDIIEKLPQNIKEKYTIVKSAPFFLEFLDKSVNKGNGVSKIAKELNIKKEEIICVGDAGNDAAMIEYAGLGVAMGNAFEEIKEMADYITLSNEEDGVCHVIKKFMLKNEEIA